MGYNVRQQNVINANDKNILCLAAASSGKTSTIIGRIRRLLDEGADPHSIVCFSFTNQAAQEMKSRIGEEGEFMQISTIHSYANFICALGGVDTAMDIASEEFDKIIEKALEVDWSIYPRVEYLFVDEFQDTDSLQYRFLERIPASHRFYCVRLHDHDGEYDQYKCSGGSRRYQRGRIILAAGYHHDADAGAIC